MQLHFKIILFLTITSFSFNLSEYSYATDLDLSKGFCDISWGTKTNTLSDLKKIAGTLNVIYYTRTENPYEIYGENLGRVIYGFYRGRLFSALLDIAGKEKFERTLNGLVDEFGSPDVQYRVGHDIYTWEIEKVKIKLKHFDIQKIHKLFFYYTPLSKMLNENEISSTEDLLLEIQ
ncbi:MAG: hypothetical protein PVI90_04585 [Desulfobacteraceae bacterium]